MNYIASPGEMAVFDPATRKVLGTVTVGKQPHWIATSPDGETAYVTNEASNDLSVVDLNARKVVATVPVGAAPRKIVAQPKAAASADGGVMVTIDHFAFPATVTATVGQAVTWANADTTSHTVTELTGQWDSGAIEPGRSFTLTPTTAGSYAYRCSMHPFMRGVLVVKPKA